MTTTVSLICGEKISDWTLLYPEGSRSWLCRCKCGTERLVDKYTLLKGVSKRCRACASQEMRRSKFAKDISGKTYSDWTVISRSEEQNKEPYWNCRCKCGTEKTVSGAALKQGKSKRCKSCASRENIGLCGLKSARNIKGEKFGKWNVIEKVSSIGGRSRWLCRCDCGNENKVMSQTLLDGRSTCCIKCSPRIGNKTHGFCCNGKIPEYQIWRSMKDRCLNPNHKGYKNYGGRGIAICDEWIESFEAFYKYIGSKPFEGASVDRINNNGNYEPGNVRWATRHQQMANTRKQKYGICVSQWSKENNLDRFQVKKRLEQGMELEEIKRVVKQPFKDYYSKEKKEVKDGSKK